MYFKLVISMSFGLVLCACGPDPAFVRPPFEGVANLAVEQVFKASEGGVLRIGNGTEIHVPADAFVDQQNQLVQGTVKLSYTELSGTSAMLVSGIPLNYGAKEDPSVMTSAAMFGLAASADGKELELAEGKSIKTIIASDVDGREYDLFRLEEEGATWDRLASVEPTDNPALDSLSKSIAQLETLGLDYDLSGCFVFNYAFDLDIVDDKDRPKLKDERFNYYTWDTAPAVETLQKILATKLKDYGVPHFLKERSWDEVSWEGSKHNPNLLLWKPEKSLPKWLTKSDLYRNPRLKALGNGRYRLDFIRWEYKDDEWKEYNDYAVNITPKMTLASLYSNPPAERSSAYEALLAQAEEEKERLAAQNKVLREFNINKMGVYNYDYIKDEERLLVKAEIFLDDVALANQSTDLFVMIKGENAVLRYDRTGLNHFVIYPGQELFAFMVVGDNGIAFQRGDGLNDLDLDQFRSNPNEPLKIDLRSSDYVIGKPTDLTVFLNREMNQLDDEALLSMN